MRRAAGACLFSPGTPTAASMGHRLPTLATLIAERARHCFISFNWLVSVNSPVQ